MDFKFILIVVNRTCHSFNAESIEVTFTVLFDLQYCEIKTYKKFLKQKFLNNLTKNSTLFCQDPKSLQDHLSQTCHLNIHCFEFFRFDFQVAAVCNNFAATVL